MPRRATNALAFDDRAIKSARFEDGRERPIRGVPRLYLRLLESGSASFVFRYGFAGRQRRVVIGDRRIVTKETAKKRATELAQQVLGGADPAAERDERRRSITLEQLVDEFMAKADRPGPRTKRDYREALDRDVLSALGHYPASDIDGQKIARVLEAVESRPPAYTDRKRWRPPEGYRGANATHKARCALGSVYRWSMKRQLVKTNPCTGLGYIQRPVVRERKVEDHELAKFWNVLDSVKGVSERMKLLLQLIALTAQRATEVAGAQITELELDGPRPRWSIPAERMKRKRPQTIALSKQAVALFKRAVELGDGEYVFPADVARGIRALQGKTARKPHIHGESISKAMLRLCAHSGLENLHAHDMRKALATWAADHSILPHVVDYILHHAPRTTTGQHYDFGTMDTLVRLALQAWADHIEAVVIEAVVAGREPESNVIQLRA